MSAFAHLPQRAALSITGDDAPGFLERLVTCRTDDMAPGAARYGALLTPQGKVIADFLLLRTAAGFLLDAPSGGADELVKRLTLFKLRAAVEIKRLDDAILLAGLEPADAPRPVSGAAHVFVDARYPGGRLRAFADRAEWRQYHGHEAEWSAPPNVYHADRIAAGVPEFGADFESAEVFPAEINMDRLGGVDLKKGCFVGQEVVSRMHRRGNIRKRTLVVSGSGLSPGEDVLAAASVGTVTSVEGETGLARLRLDRLAAAGEPLTCGGAPARVLGLEDGWIKDEMGAFHDD